MFSSKFLRYRPLMHFNYFCTNFKHDSLSKKLMLVIDTNNVVQEFKTSGFTENQAEALKNFALNLVNTQANILEKMNTDFIKRPEYEMYKEQLLADLSSIKMDMVNSTMESFNKMKYENEKSKMEIQLLRQQLKEDIDKTNNGMTLDINLGQSRTRDDHNQIRSEVVKTQNRIDSQIALLRTVFEEYRNDVFKYAVLTVLIVAAVSVYLYNS